MKSRIAFSILRTLTPTHHLLKISLILLAVFVMPFGSQAQDLIERTQLGIGGNNETEEPNALALKVASTLSNARSHQVLSLFEVASEAKSQRRSVEGSAVLLEVQAAEIEHLANNPHTSMSMMVPVDHQSSLRLNLIRSSPLSKDFEVIASSPADVGQNNLGIFYHGTVHGDPTSTVAVSVFNDRLDIFIDDGQGYYRVSKEESSDYLFYNARTTGDFGQWKCHNNHSHSSFQEVRVTPEKSLGRSAMMGCVPVYIEADFAMFQQEGANTTAYITSLMNQTVAIYASIGISIEMSELFIHTTVDPWAGQSLGNKLDNFGLAKGDAYNGRLAHLITAEEGGGVAWVDVLCATSNAPFTDGPYGVSGAVNPTNPSTSDVITLAHELGHNFGSDHTQACVWNGNNTAIDGCVFTEDGPNGETCPRPTPNCPVGGGTIMSYCDAFDPPVTACTVNTTWHPQVQTLITNNWNAATAACLNTTCGGGGTPTGYTCADPFIINAAGTFNAPGPSQGNGAAADDFTHANWYRFNAPTTGTITISSCGLPGGHDGTHNHVYHDWNNTWGGSCANVDVDNVIYTADRGCPANPGDETEGAYESGIPVTAGQPIYIEWDDAYSTQGFTWSITYDNMGPCPPNVTVDPPSVSGNVSASSTITTGDPVTLSGNTVFSAPEVILGGVFTAPLGLTFEILMAGCIGGGGAAGNCADPIIGACDGTTIQGDLNGGESNINAYDGQTGYGGPERVHSIPIPANVTVTVTMQPEATVDLDIFDMDDCAAGTTFGASALPGDGVQESFMIDNTGEAAFTLTLVIDGWQGDVGTYTLTVTCN